jgi:hypothetical protein
MPAAAAGARGPHVADAVHKASDARAQAAAVAQGRAGRAGIHLVCLCISKLCLMLAQHCTICTVFSKGARVSGAARKGSVIETGVATGVLGTAVLAINVPMSLTPEIEK